MLCPRCSKEIDKGDRFCRFCGLALVSGTPATWKLSMHSVALRERTAMPCSNSGVTQASSTLWTQGNASTTLHCCGT